MKIDQTPFLILKSKLANFILNMVGQSKSISQQRICLVIPPRGIMVGMKADTKKQMQNRLRRVEGQVRGLQKMVDEGAYCIDIITQSSAIRSALSSAEDLMLQNHLQEHVIHQMRRGEEKKAVGEIIKVFKRAKRK